MDQYNHWLPKLLGKLNKSTRYAITLGQTAYYSVSKEEVLKSPTWVKHENEHKKQWKRDGLIKFSIKYIYYLIRYGYYNNPYEIEARKAASK